MPGRRAGLGVAVVAVSAACLWACSATNAGRNGDLGEKMQKWSAGRALAEGVERQTRGADEGVREVRQGILKPGEPIWLQSGKSRVLELAQPVRRVSLGNPDLAGIVVLGPRTLMVNAKALEEEKKASAQPAGGRIMALGRPGVGTGVLTSAPRMSETTLAIWHGRDESPDVHTLFVAEFLDQQVLLEVTVAEISRTGLEQHGIDFRQIGDSFVSAYFMGGGIRLLTEGTVPPTQGPLLPLRLGQASPQFAFQLPKDDITAFISLLQGEGLATILAQPKLLAMSGQTAVFQVGGEIPIRIVTSFVADIEFKPFGTLISFVPRVSEEGDIILTVTPEVSQPDFTQTVEDIPTFRTRRASTSVRLRSDETLVIGGLMQTLRREEQSGIPYLKDLPAIGYIFRDTQFVEETTELMVVVTPRLARPLAPGTTMALPTDRGPLNKDDVRTRPEESEVTRPRFPEVLLP